MIEIYLSRLILKPDCIFLNKTTWHGHNRNWLVICDVIGLSRLKIEHTLLEWKIEFIERLSVILRASKNKSAHSMGFSSGPTDSIV